MCFALNLDLGFLGESLVVLWRMSETSALNGNPSVSAGRYLRRTRLLERTSSNWCFVEDI